MNKAGLTEYKSEAKAIASREFGIENQATVATEWGTYWLVSFADAERLVAARLGTIAHRFYA
jgi:hypothetical protein